MNPDQQQPAARPEPRPTETELIFKQGAPGRRAFRFPDCDVPLLPLQDLIPERFLAEEPPDLPEVSELEIVRHFTRLSQKTLGVDSAFYPLGSCTMKYNPKLHEKLSSLPGFTELHPLQPEETVQGMLELFHRLEKELAELCGLEAVSLQPAAGAHGELTGLMMIRAYLRDQGLEEKDVVLIPDSAHGTNPASCTLCGFRTRQLSSNEKGCIEPAELRGKCDAKTAALMITNPNTLGLFEPDIEQLAEVVHGEGGLVYMDGANMNALVGTVRPGDFGIDVLHLNLHKTFATPHGAGGPGSGPVAANKKLAPYLPVPRVIQEGEKFRLVEDFPKSIGKVKQFYGNVNVFVRAYCYLRRLGPEGLKRVSEHAVLNACYLLSLVADHYKAPYGRRCMHEFVLSASRQRKQGVRALDIAKRLLDFGFHPPTIYFPLIVPEALMIEPTETESRETLERFAKALIQIAREARDTPERCTSAPHATPVGRLDEVTAARKPVLRV